MTSETRSPAEIEREIERERAGLTSTLDDLQSKFSVESIARQFSDQFREHGGEFGRSISDAVKRNPVALTLTGVGLAWLMLGNKSGDDRDDDRAYDRRESFSSDRDEGDSQSYSSRQYDRRKSTPQPTAPIKTYRPGRYAGQNTTPSWARHDDHENSGSSVGSKMHDTANGVGDSVSKAASSVGGAASSIADSVTDSVKSAGNKISETGASAAERGQAFSDSVSERAVAFRKRLAEGTEHLSEEARIRVVAARERAVEARDAAMAYGRQGTEKATDLFQDHPMIAGALAVAVGAAFAAALPRSQTEDHYLGAQSDQLMEDAERIFSEETSKLKKVATAATDEAKKVLHETREEAEGAASAVTDKVKASGERIADAAKEEADKQHLGHVENT